MLRHGHWSVSGVHDVKNHSGCDAEQAQQMRQTRLEKLFPTLPRPGGEPHQARVRAGDADGVTDVEKENDQPGDAVHLSGTASESDDGPVLAVELVYGRTTQVQSGRQGHHQGQAAEGQEPGQAQQRAGPAGRHHRVIVQGSAHGHVSVVGHEDQDGVVRRCTGVNDEDLQQAPLVGYLLNIRQQIPSELGVEAAGAVESVDTQAAQEKVHGFVEAFVHNDCQNKSQVCRQSQTGAQ